MYSGARFYVILGIVLRLVIFASIVKTLEEVFGQQNYPSQILEDTTPLRP